MKKFLGMSVAAFALATAAFWATMLTDPPKSEADTIVRFDVNKALQDAPKDAPIQNANVVACTYVLADFQHCN